MGEVVVHTFGGVDHFELRGDEEAEEIFVRQAAVTTDGVVRFELSHAVKETQEEGRREMRRINLLIPQFLDETAVTVVGRPVGDTQVIDGEMQFIAVDMVDDFPFGAIRDTDEGAYHEVVTIFASVCAA